MGLSHRCFVVDEATGTLRKVSAKQATDAIQGHGKWPGMAGKTVRVLALLCDQKRGRIYRVAQAVGYRVQVLADGTCDGEALMRQAQESRYRMLREAGWDEGSTEPVDPHQDRFEAKKLFNQVRWEPTDKQVIAAMRLLKLIPPPEIPPPSLLPLAA